MLFHSAIFLCFFLPVFLVYWRLNHQNQNRWLLFTSYLFYGLWDWRFIPLLGFSSLISYALGNGIDHTEDAKDRRKLLTLGIIFNLSILGLFKYFNFFIDNFFRLFHLLGGEGRPPVLSLLMPLGISFYTFKAVSYCIDIYRGQIKPAKSFSDFALYMSFFPQLISGPIDRPSGLIPQITAPRIFLSENLQQGFFLIGWGLFQKLFIADNLAGIVNPVFNASSPDASQILLALYVYAFQLYHDFAGYSHMAWGIAKIMGFETTQNFNLPFFASNIQSFWNRWHISLSVWIREYLYTPVFLAAGGLATIWRLYFATMISMIAIGLWHGAAWHYVLYGVYHGLLLCVYAAVKPWLQRVNPKHSAAAALWQGVRILFVFHLTAIGFLIFRAESCGQFFQMMSVLVSAFPHYPVPVSQAAHFIFFIWIAIVVEYFQFSKNDRWALFQWHPAARTAFYVLCFFMLCLHGADGAKDFIYFQF